MKLAIFKDGFWLFLLASVGVHALVFFVVPDPLKQADKTAEKTTEMEVVGTVPVVTLPKKKASILPKLSQVPKQDIPSSQPNERPKDEAPKTTLSTVLDVPPTKEPEKLENPVKSPIKPEPKPTPKDESKIDKSIDKSDQLAPQKDSLTENPTSSTKETNNPDVASSDVDSEQANQNEQNDQTGSGATISPDQFRREFGKTYAEYASKYGPENVVQRIIPSPQETTISQVSQTIEPGIEWIPPLEQPKATDLKGKNTKVIVTFIVDPQGKVVKKSMFASENRNVNTIVYKTVAGYESKFTPLEGKIRIVTINYEFPG
jgi:outer membrane biosynthesis protein TonB